MSESAALLLLPNSLGEGPGAEALLPGALFAVMRTIDGLIAESEKGGRRYLRRFETKKPAAALPIALYNEHTRVGELDFFLEPIEQGERWGLVSDAGLPCTADPGAALVLRARQRGLHVQAIAGPSSVMLALMLSGLPGQKFYFQGYLDRDPARRRDQIAFLARQSKSEGATQVVMEAPYRNRHLLNSLLQTLPSTSWLSVAWELTLPAERVVTRRVAEWKAFPQPDLEKRPAIFMFHTHPS